MCSIYLTRKRLFEEMVALVNCPDSIDEEYWWILTKRQFRNKKNKKNTDGLGGNICHIKWFPLKEKFCMADSDERWIQAYRD